MEKKRRGNERLMTNRLTMSCYYIVRVLCARGAGIQIKKEKGSGGGRYETRYR